MVGRSDGSSGLIDERKATNPRAQEVIAILGRGEYLASSGARVPIGDAQRAAEEATVLHTPRELEELRLRRPAGLALHAH